jgi:pentatricopeptide repeat protein
MSTTSCKQDNFGQYETFSNQQNKACIRSLEQQVGFVRGIINELIDGCAKRKMFHEASQVLHNLFILFFIH